MLKNKSSSSSPYLRSTRTITPDTLSRNHTPISKPPDHFFLWIPEQLLDLENEIQSKKRTLELLSGQTSALDSNLLDQLKLRDIHISTLNKTILDLKTTIKSLEDSRKSKNWEKEFLDLEKQLQEARQTKKDDQSRISFLEHQISELTQDFENEKDELEIVQETLKEEIEEFKAILNSKDEELRQSDESIFQLQKIIENMSKLNSELHVKIEQKNKETAEIIFQSQENVVKAKQFEEIEKKLTEYITEKIALEKRISSLVSELSNITRINSIIDWACKNLEILEDGIKKQYESLSQVRTDQVEKFLIDVGFFFQELSSSVITIKHNIQSNMPKINEGLTSESNLRNILKEKENELQANSEYVTFFKAKEQALQDSIKDLQLIMEKNGIEYKNSVSQLSKNIGNFNEEFARLKNKISEQITENGKILSELNMTKSKLAHITGKFELVHKRKKDLQSTEVELKKSLSELREKLSSLLEAKKNSGVALNSNEIKLKKILTQAQILRDEVFRKDTELVKSAREKLKFDQELDQAKQASLRLQSKIKGIEAEIYEKVSDELSDKDRQIEILKEMLRSAHSEIKLKDLKISGFSKKTEEFDRFKSPRRRTNS